MTAFLYILYTQFYFGQCGKAVEIGRDIRAPYFFTVPYYPDYAATVSDGVPLSL
jgi:hypothetical protein